MHRVDVIVFDGIPRTYDACVFQTGNGGNYGFLYIQRKACRYAVRIAFLRSDALRLKEDLMSFLFRKTCDFVFYRRAVSCASPLNDAREQWGTVETFANDFMRTRVGPGYVAGKLRKCVSLAMKAEAGGRFVAKLGRRMRGVVPVFSRPSFSP